MYRIALGLLMWVTPALAQSIGTCPVFPSNNVWNARVDTLPVHAKSDAYVNSIGAASPAHADFGSGTWNGEFIGIPYITVPGNQLKVPITFTYWDESDPGPYPIPANAPIEGGSAATGDRHVLVIDSDNCILYEVFAAYPQPDGSWKGGSGAIFDLKANKLRPATWTSADAAGLPIFPGLVRYDEVAAGEIRHALRFTAPKTQMAFIWPARHFASSITDTNYPPMGARFRLKSTVNISGYSPEAQVIMRALQKYGMILADNGSSWFVSGTQDQRWNNDNIGQLRNLHGTDFEAVDESSLMSDPNSAAVNNPMAMSVSRSSLNFGASGSLTTGAQKVRLTFSGAVNVVWAASSNQPNITVTPASGTGNAVLQIAAAAGASGLVTISAPSASASQTIQVKVASVTPAAPFGSFDTPANNTSGLAGAIPVSGWSLDNIEVSSVGIWREPLSGETASANGLVFIGSAVFVADARPDVQANFPNAPLNYRGGWGYMLLTNFLPGGGNGAYKLHAIAVDKAGLSTDLGTHAISADNTHAAKPFGTIDTPDQGGMAAGSAFVNFGWALTQNPNLIALDGTTITVNVDGVPLGHPVYNQFRNDLATLFPGLGNSAGAVGYFVIDTTKLADGVHTIAWTVYDSQGHGDGIGSRFFTVENGMAAAASEDVPPAAGESPDRIDLQELERVEVNVGAGAGYLLVDGERQPLPAGSTLKDGVFYWQTAPGLLGDYNLVFERANHQVLRVHATVRPKI